MQSLRNQLNQAISAEQSELPVDSSSRTTLFIGDELQSGFDEFDGSLSVSNGLDQFISPPPASQNQHAIAQEQEDFSISSITGPSWVIGDLTVGQAEVQDCFHA